MDDPIFAPMLDPARYLAAWRRVRRVSGWKDSTQAFGLSLLPSIRKLVCEVASGEYRPGPLSVFTVRERGHERLVRALCVRDRLLQHVLCDDVLIPGLRRFLIHDNSASLKGKGMGFCHARLMCHLQRHLRAHGTAGHILLIDYRRFFDSIPHGPLVDAICARLPSARLRALLETICQQYEGIAGDGDPRRGLGIGAPFSQVAGVFHPTPIDTYCKTVLGCHAYARYMDDTYIIHPSRDFLLGALEGIRGRAAALGLAVHPGKTRIAKLAHGFTWLKVRYSLTETGAIIRRPWPQNITRHRRKLRALARAVAAGAMPFSDLVALHRSWLGDKRWYNAHRTILNTNRIFKEIIDAIPFDQRD